MIKSQFELLAPGGDLESIKAAIVAGADAIYCGLEQFNARNRATNLSLDNFKDMLELAHQHDCKIFLTLNIILLEHEIQTIVRLLNQLVNMSVDGVIIQDLGLAYILQHYFPTLDVHASTQLNTHNDGQILFLQQLGVSRVNLSRELNIEEIHHLAQFGRQHQILTEVFVHGSYCIGFSGLCYISSARNGASGNRGRCSQPCRDTYQTTDVGVNHPLNLKDNSAFLDLKQLADAGVYSLKVEGRMKKPHYVYTVVDNWRKQIDQFCATGELLTDTTELYKVFNRDFSNGYLQGNMTQAMFIDNPRNHSADHFIQQSNSNTEAQIQQIKRQLYDENTEIIQQVDHKIKQLVAPEQRSNVATKKIPACTVPKLKHVNLLEEEGTLSPELAVLIGTPEDAILAASTSAHIYYQLPNNLNRKLDELVALFRTQRQLIPWFPAILIGDDYLAAAQLLDLVKPEKIVTNNTGIAFLAYQKGIDWIAGPQLNTINSYTIKCMKEVFHCTGAFISNEIQKSQIRAIVRPNNFRLFYSIYHPMNLLTSRQCLFQQSVGCRKQRVTKGCLPNCKKSASIINLNGAAYIIDKQQGEHNSLYSEHHYLNMAVLSDLPQQFTDLLIDLREIKTETKVTLDKQQLIHLFQQRISQNNQQDSENKINNALFPTSNTQYYKGL